ncbi:class I adenylate-forming enzyme family protein [Sphingomonas crocodyli]|uniref:Long-chain fatty acid--CoA ligase n=1 Tax=Sphingomonas crocodyli TaxID=1979270 RepID=A0A437MA11_9SPHN|nr:class I adenylate-forming enzyme family protein [Sphingomonas crocodyli]RVT94458.1 long-chain fatty acid--CoA ligase [Sphingomonas crocodyli]
MSDIYPAYAEIVSRLTAPGAPFEIVPVAVRGEEIRAYAGASENLIDIYLDTAAKFADRPLLWENGDFTSYAEMFAAAWRLAGGLADRFGVGPGDRVGIVMRNRGEYLLSLFACARIGAVAVLVNSRGSADELSAATSDVDCKVIIADGPRAALLRKGGCDAPIVFIPEDDRPVDVSGATPFAELTDARQAEAPIIRVALDDPCWILFTSGTSGRPKGAVLTQRNITQMIHNLGFYAASGMALAATLMKVEIDVIRKNAKPPSNLLIVPLFHISGLTAIAGSLMGGGLITIMRRWDKEEAARLIAANSVTQLTGPPMVFEDLLDLPDGVARMATINNVAIGGQALPPNLAQRIRDAFPRVSLGNGWGMTEASGSVCAGSGPLMAPRPRSAGMICPVMETRAVDETGKVLPAGESGELQVRGPFVMAGYWNQPEKTAEVLKDGWYATGDVGFIDAQGYIHIVDRLKEMIITHGENVYCAEVERVLEASGQFLEVSTFGIPDERAGELMVAAVVPRPDGPKDAAGVKAIAKAGLADYKVPAHVMIGMRSLPRTATGKVEKRKLREAFLANLETA